MGVHLPAGIKRARNRLAFVLAGLTVVAIGCASPSSPGTPGSGQAAQPQSAPKRLVAAVASTPYALNASLGAYLGSAPGMEALGALVNSGFVIVDHEGNLQPLLAERVPTAENGDWKVFPNGKMDVKWVIREGAKWHDGTPVTSDDIRFTYQLAIDRELAIFARSEYRIIESLETPDPRTVIVHWMRPFLYANLVFGYGNDNSNLPLPKHILEAPYQGDRDTFLNLPYWTSEFVGTGPYKLKEWDPGTGVSFVANDAFVRGRPKIDEIEVRYITAFNTLAANLLAGTVQVNFGRGFSFEQGMTFLEQSPNLKADFAAIGAYSLYPAFTHTNPPALLNVNFRRALMQAINRQEMVDTFMRGSSSVAHTFINPKESDYEDIESAVVKYPYDPQAATPIMQGLGYIRGSDGMLRDASGPLRVEIRASATNDADKIALATADHLKQAGIGAEVVVPPPQLDADIEYASTYPGLQLVRRGNFRWDLKRPLSSAEAPLPENKFNGGNRGRYMNAELDILLDRYETAVGYPEHVQLLREIVHHVSDQLPWMGLFYATDATIYDARLQGVHGKWERTTQVWNIWEWDYK